jgi:hypothetical protein
MFCIYCGARNPDDATYCSVCGKLAAGNPASAPSPNAVVPNVPAPKEIPAPAPIPVAVETPKITTLPPQIIETGSAPPVSQSPRKKHGVRWGLIATGLVLLLILAYPLKDGSSLCDATKNVVVQQVPDALEVLAARHPLQVGLVRSMFNDQGAVDKFAEDYVSNNMLKQDPGTFACYVGYYVAIFNKERIGFAARKLIGWKNSSRFTESRRWQPG